MPYPSFEARMTREQATKTLTRICERLDTCATTTYAIALKQWLTGDSAPDNSGTLTFTAKRLWAVGSYSRGALTCGDIDLVMEMEGDMRWYDTKPFHQQLLKSPRRVSLYLGTPHDNSSGGTFPDARLVWEAGQDWRAMLAAIEPDASASRFARPTDGIPFRLSQLPHCSLPWAENAIARRERGELEWQYIPLDKLARAAAGVEREKAFRVFEKLAREYGTGEKSRRLLPYLYAYAQRHYDAHWDWDIEGRARIRNGRTVFVLNATPNLEELDAPGVSTLVAMPHLSSRGPNGLWVVRRGAQHPLVRAFARCKAWVVADENSNPVVTEWHGPNRSVNIPWRAVMTLDIFTTEEEALLAIKRYPRNLRKKRVAKQVKGGAAFQQIIDGCDMLDGGLDMTVFTEKGLQEAQYHAGFEREELTQCTIEELARLFRKRAGKTKDAKAAKDSATSRGGISWDDFWLGLPYWNSEEA